MQGSFNIKQLLKWGTIGAAIGICWILVWIIAGVAFSGTHIKELFWSIMALPYTILEQFLFENSLINKHNVTGFWAVFGICFGVIGFLIGVVVFALWRFVKGLLL